MNHDAAIVLQARIGSTRLRGKVLALVAGRTVLAHCVERLQASGLPVLLATTRRAEDDAVADAGVRLGIEVLRGEDEDVLARYVQVVESYGLTEVIRATADNPCVDIDAPLRTLTLLRRTQADHVVEHGLPYGAAVEAVSGAALVRANVLATDPYDREHVTPLIRRDPTYRALVAVAPGALRRPNLRLTIDTYEDLKAVRAIVTEAERECRAPVPLARLIAVALRVTDTPDTGDARQGAP